MPHNNSLIPKKHSYKILFGQRPLTKFKDYRKSIKVDLVKYDDREKMLKGTYDFVKATWSEDGLESGRVTEQEMSNALEMMMSGKALGLGLETVNLMFRISGITRIDTHQIVRQRIGVTFSQQCTGDRFLHHNDVLVEESIVKEPSLGSFINATLHAKNSYSQMIDSMNVSIQAARSILPHNLETFIFMNTNLATILFFYQKRIDDGSQTWQMNEISRQMAEEICKVYPELIPVFEKFKTKFKFQEEASKDRNNTFATNLYLPKIDNFDYHERDFLYDKTKEEMHFTNTPIKDSFFWGFDEISEDKYNLIRDAYDKTNKHCEELKLTNREILERNQLLNQNLQQL